MGLLSFDMVGNGRGKYIGGAFDGAPLHCGVLVGLVDGYDTRHAEDSDHHGNRNQCGDAPTDTEFAFLFFHVLSPDSGSTMKGRPYCWVKRKLGHFCAGYLTVNTQMKFVTVELTLDGSKFYLIAC